jgi:argonaute-like protein implicated in RNA metabolism and viral defense
MPLRLKIKSRIYRDKIHPAFFKLTENIIHTFKFYYTEVDEIEHLQHEVITFLIKQNSFV